MIRDMLLDEVAALEADEADRAEMLDVASMMESLRGAWWPNPDPSLDDRP